MRVNWIASIAFLTLLGCQQQQTQGPTAAPQIFYSPATNLEGIDVRLISNAQRSIDVCAYSLTDRAVIQALQQAAAHGVRIRIYLDRTQAEGEFARESRSSSRSRNHGLSEAPIDPETLTDDGTPDDTLSTAELATLGSLNVTPHIEVRIKHSKTLMHLKSYVVDGATLRSGSANFSPTGEKRQDNDLVLTTDATALANFKRNFEVLWSRTDNEPLTNR